MAVTADLSTAAKADQTAPSEPPGFYSPKGSQQSPPLRVEVMEGVKFRDIETGDVYRLYGIDACAPAQRATLGRQPWPCGVMATAWLVSATLGKWVACAKIHEIDGVIQARCASSQHGDLGATMLREGLAVAVPVEPPLRTYAALEQDARKAYRGLWASRFQMPGEFRRNAAPSSAEVEGRRR
ncbi:nuclease (plasmid) [Bosea vestrisii]|uniref:thermonuclease family protein n=1 Tax=Bosea vestrisii TaxID=151416 RepID=UPI0024DFAD6A|nr:thermonuclease family protein [Bosea vestrisii]WID99752.1 nuclease [Bosea vestrisii]